MLVRGDDRDAPLGAHLLAADDVDDLPVGARARRPARPRSRPARANRARTRAGVVGPTGNSGVRAAGAVMAATSSLGRAGECAAVRPLRPTLVGPGAAGFGRRGNLPRRFLRLSNPRAAVRARAERRRRDGRAGRGRGAGRDRSGCAVLVEDARHRPLWWSAQGEVDAVRSRSILQREVPPQAAALVASLGLAHATGPVRTPALPEVDMAERWCVPLRGRAAAARLPVGARRRRQGRSRPTSAPVLRCAAVAAGPRAQPAGPGGAASAGGRRCWPGWPPAPTRPRRAS